MTLDENTRKAIEKTEANREDNRGRVTAVLVEAGRNYKEKVLATTEIHIAHDIHAFYRLTADRSKVVHVQAYPGMSSENEMKIMARMMNYDVMMEIRENSRTSIGNEHSAVTVRFRAGLLIDIPYEAKALEELLAKYVPELKLE